MARLEAVAKGLYYPTPLRVMDLIADTVRVSCPGGTIFDPCAGEGDAVRVLAERWGLRSYGVELDVDRARKAATQLDVCLQGSYHQLHVEPEALFSVLFLNPPYDISAEEDGSSIRQEVVFLEDTARLLAPGGLLVFVPPRHILQNSKFQDVFRRSFRNASVWAFPAPECDAFDQMVVVAQRLGPSTYGGYHYYSAVEVFQQESHPVLGTSSYGTRGDDGEQQEVHLPSPSVERFEMRGVAPESIAPSFGDEPTGAYASPSWLALTDDDPNRTEVPLVAPRPGHQAMLLAAGALNGLEIGGMLVKGGSTKIVQTIERETETIERERIVSHLSVLSLQTGSLDTWRVDEEPQKTAEWFTQHRDALRGAILASHTPSFDGSLDGYDFSGLRAPGVLPGHSAPEILPIQKQTAAAIVHWWDQHKTAILSGEMGVGKTTIAITACELARHERVVVVCPTHLVSKWIRECESITGTPGVAVTASKISEVEAFFAERDVADTADDGVLGMFQQRPVRPRYLVLSKERAKLGARWEPAYQTRRVVIAREVAKYETDSWGRRDRVGTEIVKRKEDVVACPSCGAIQIGENVDLRPRHMDNKLKRKCFRCKSVLWASAPINAKGTVRWPLAQYINRRHARRYALVLDEAHAFGKAETDQSRAVQTLASTATKILPMTGTLYGGRASSLFHLLYKVDHGFRQMYRYSQCARFVEHHGLFEKIYKEDESTSVYGYRRGRSGGRLKEIPGMSPAMIPMLLQYTIFVKLHDLQMNLPPYSEEVVLVDHDREVEAEVRRMGDSVVQVMRRYPSVLGQYLMACLGYPDRPDQAEEIVSPGTEEEPPRVLASARAFPSDRTWPKDERLVEIAREEHRAGRKMLVFMTQTKRRDARPRVRQALEAAGLRVSVLESSVPPDKREEWLRKEVKKGFDVLLTNGRLVETGLDLLFAHTIVQYGTEYSVNTLRQSIRRSWRLGQTQPVRVLFMAYRSTMQETALNLIARKMRAAEMVDGDEAGGLAQHDVGGANFLVELAHEVLSGGDLLASTG